MTVFLIIREDNWYCSPIYSVI